MKKLFMLLALALGVASCQNEPEGFDVVVGGEQEVMLNVSLPEATRGTSAQGFDFTNFAANDNLDLRFILEIRYQNGDETKVVREVKTSETTSATFPVRLAPKRVYTFTVWADLVKQGPEGYEAADLFYDTTSLQDITLKTVEDEDIRDIVELRDAYTHTDTFNFTEDRERLNMTLVRPFAKVRVVATDLDKVTKFGIIPDNAAVEYTSDVHNSFNAVTGNVNDGKGNPSFTYNISANDYGEVSDENEVNDRLTVFADYIFVPNNGGTISFNLNINQGTDLIKANPFSTQIPVEKNKVTSIVGDVLTEGGNVSITINGTLEEKETIKYVDTAESLQKTINNIAEGESGNIKLGGDIDLNDLLGAGILSTRAAEPTYGLLIPAGKRVVLDLQGYTISQVKECKASYSMIQNNGNLTIIDSSKAKSGKISFKDTSAGDPTFGWGSYTISNYGGTLVVENGTIEHLGEQDAHMICAIWQYNGSTTINGGVISTPYYRSARLWSGDMTINGGVFEGQLWLQASNNNAELTINGGTFAPRGGDSSSVYVTNSGKIVQFAVTGGDFKTKIGMSEPFGCITGGTFTTTAKEGTNAALLGNGYAFVEGENGTYTVENVGHYTDAEGNYYITNAKGLAWVSENVNTMEFYVSGSANIFDNKTVYLTNNIDLGGAEWRPIGDYAFSRTSFNGVFDGQGYTVSNFKVTEPVRWTEKVTEASYGFFGNVKGTIKNLTIKNATVNPEGGRYSAALVGRLHNGGCIENCHVENSSVTILHWQVGGLVGQNNNGNISDCSVVGSTITGKAAVGAIVGMDMTNGEHTIENCRVANTALVQNESFGASYDASYGLAVGLVNASGIVLNIDNVVAENSTIKGVADNTLVGDIETGATVTINGVSIATTAEQLAAAIKAGGECALGADIAMTAATYQNVDVTIDGNGHTISQAEGTTNEFALFDSVTGKITLKNVKFAGIKGGAVLRTIDAEATLDNVTVEGAETTQQQGLLRLIGKSTIKNSTFKNNTCSMVITLNFDGPSDTDQLVENCVFEGNTCNGTAALYYVKGASATINGNKFIGNTVNCSSNGATIYMGFTENNVVTNNLFQNNTVNEAGTSSRVAGGIFFGYETVFTGNAFVGNNVTGENAKGKDVCVSTYYTSIDLSGNYWGGNAPVEDTNYFVQHKSDERVVTINNYLTANPFN